MVNAIVFIVIIIPLFAIAMFSIGIVFNINGVIVFGFLSPIADLGTPAKTIGVI